MPGKLIIICGLPGSGKTTHARSLEGSLGAIRFCADDWMTALGLNPWDTQARSKVESLQWPLAQRLIQLGQTVVIEWGTWAKSERDALREGARALNAKVELHYVSAPLDVLFRRIQRRGVEQPPIMREHLDQWINLFEAPHPQEAALYDHFWSDASAR